MKTKTQSTRKINKQKHKKRNQSQTQTKSKTKNEIVNCCRHTRKNKRCIRKPDGKIFGLPRKWTRKQCLNSKPRGFTMQSSCAPYIQCK